MSLVQLILLMGWQNWCALVCPTIGATRAIRMVEMMIKQIPFVESNQNQWYQTVLKKGALALRKICCKASIKMLKSFSTVPTRSSHEFLQLLVGGRYIQKATFESVGTLV